MKKTIDLALSVLKNYPREMVLFCLTIILLITVSSVQTNAQTTSKMQGNDPQAIKWGQMIDKAEGLWEGQYESYFGQDFHTLSLSAPRVSERLLEISQQTGKRAAVLWAMIHPDEEEIALFLITPGDAPTGKLVKNLQEDKVLKTIVKFVNEVSQPTDLDPQSPSYLPLARQLNDWIIAPIEPTLKAKNIDTLILCVGAGLRSIPFAALYDGKQFLIEKYSLTRVPGFNLTDIGYQPLENVKVLAMGASEFEAQQSLPGVEVELANITPNPWDGVAILNQDFTLTNLEKQREKEPFQIIHLATHAEFVPGAPSNSYIQFSDTRLTLAEIQNLNWHNPPVSLLVLSACKTAVGDKQAEMGFAGLALQAGVKSALASLWYVSDAGTLALMSEFYQNLKTTPFKAEALREAQISMLKGDVYLNQNELVTSRGNDVPLPQVLVASGEQELNHPYYWASFSLIGSPW